jgi:hypothetical protein
MGLTTTVVSAVATNQASNYALKKAQKSSNPNAMFYLAMGMLLLFVIGSGLLLWLYK